MKPNATIFTLQSLMREEQRPVDFKRYVPQLSESAQFFFEQQFHNKKTYGETKEQILWRLDLFLGNPRIAQMFSRPKTQFDLLREMRAGKVILIDTSFKHLGDDGSSFLGRLFIAFISSASKRRNPNERPAFVYIDEIASYLDHSIESILELARESRIGLTLAHQQLSQLSKLSSQLLASVLTNTRTKYIGSVSESDARTLASEMRVDWGVLQHQNALHFHLKVKGFINRAITFKVKAGLIESMPMRTDAQMADLVRYEEPLLKVAEEETVYHVTEPTPDVDTPDDGIESLNRA